MRIMGHNEKKHIHLMGIREEEKENGQKIYLEQYWLKTSQS